MQEFLLESTVPTLSQLPIEQNHVEEMSVSKSLLQVKDVVRRGKKKNKFMSVIYFDHHSYPFLKL